MLGGQVRFAWHSQSLFEKKSPQDFFFGGNVHPFLFEIFVSAC
jgi:hypothetical protein